MMSDLIQEHRQFIEKLVRANSKFSGNEDLFEDFCSEAYERSLMIINNVSNIENVQGYLKKIVNTSILNVLKNERRMTSSSKYSTVTRKENLPKIEEVPNTIPAEFTIEQPVFDEQQTAPIVEEPVVDTIELPNEEADLSNADEINIDTELNFETQETENIDNIAQDNYSSGMPEEIFEQVESIEETQEVQIQDDIPEIQIEQETTQEVITFEEQNIEEPQFVNIDVINENEQSVDSSFLSFETQNIQPEQVFDIKDPAPSIEEIVVSREILSKIYKLVRNLEAKNPNKYFLDIFNLRYFQEKKQGEIADELGISQGEVSKRLLELSLMVRQEFR